MPQYGRNDFWEDGSWNAVCFECGRKFKAGALRKHWRGYWVCPQHWEPRQPQDFVRGIPEHPTPPFVQPLPALSFVNFCTPEGITGIAGWAVAGCAIADYVSPAFDSSTTFIS